MATPPLPGLEKQDSQTTVGSRCVLTVVLALEPGVGLLNPPGQVTLKCWNPAYFSFFDNKVEEMTTFGAF